MSTSTATTGFNFFLDFDRQRQVFVAGNLHAFIKLRFNIPAAEETVMSDLNKTIGQNMKKKSS